jgi:putative oxidoreductase
MTMRERVARAERCIAGTRRAAFIALWAMLVAQIIWMAVLFARTPPLFANIYYAVIFTPVAAALALTGGRVRWIAALTRLLIGIAFFENVIDRLGFIGPPGAPGVSWGDFQHFIAYTAVVNAFAPAALIPALAIVATIFEGSFGITMLLGLRVRLASAGSALLLFAFATAMVISGLSQFSYAVYLMSAAAWYLSTVDASALSIDSLLAAPSLSAA